MEAQLDLRREGRLLREFGTCPHNARRARAHTTHEGHVSVQRTTGTCQYSAQRVHTASTGQRGCAVCEARAWVHAGANFDAWPNVVVPTMIEVRASAVGVMSCAASAMTSCAASAMMSLRRFGYDVIESMRRGGAGGSAG